MKPKETKVYECHSKQEKDHSKPKTFEFPQLSAGVRLPVVYLEELVNLYLSLVTAADAA